MSVNNLPTILCFCFFRVESIIWKVLHLELIVLVQQSGNCFYIPPYLFSSYGCSQLLYLIQYLDVKSWCSICVQLVSWSLCQSLCQDLNICINSLARHTATKVCFQVVFNALPALRSATVKILEQNLWKSKSEILNPYLSSVYCPRNTFAFGPEIFRTTLLERLHLTLSDI